MRMYHPRQLEKENDYNNYSTAILNQRKQSPYQQPRLGSAGVISQPPAVCVLNNPQSAEQVFTLIPKAQLIQNRQLIDQQFNATYFGDYCSQGQRNFEAITYQTPDVKQYVSKIPQYYLDKSSKMDLSGQHKQTRSQNSVYANHQILHDSSSTYQEEDSIMSVQKPNSQLKKIVGVKKSNQKNQQKSQCNLNLTFTQGQRQQSYCNLSSVIQDRSQSRIKVTLQATTSRNTSPQLKHVPTVSGVQSHTKSNSRVESTYGVNSKKNSSSSNQLNNKNNISLMMNKSNITNDEVDLTYTNTQRSGINHHQNSHRTQSLVPQNLFKKYNQHEESTDLGYQPPLQSNYSQSSLPLNNFASVGQNNAFNVGRLLFNEHFEKHQSNRQESSLNKRNLSFNQLLDSQRQIDTQISRQQVLLSSSGRKYSSQVPERFERPITRFNDSGKKDESEIQNVVETLKQNILKDLQEVSKRFLSKEGKHTDQQIMEDNNNRFSFNQSEYNQFTNHLLSKQIQKQSQQSLLKTSISSQQSSGKKQYNKLVNSDVAKQCFQREGAELFNQLSQVINNGKEFFSQITASKNKKNKEEEFNSPNEKKPEEKVKSNTPSFQKHLRTSSYKRILPSPLQLSFNMVEPPTKLYDNKVAPRPPIPTSAEKREAINKNKQDFEESPVCIKIKRNIEVVQESQKQMSESMNNPLSQEDEEFKDENGPQTRRESHVVDDLKEDSLSLQEPKNQDDCLNTCQQQQHFETPQPTQKQSQELSEFHDAEPEEEQIFLQIPSHSRQESSYFQRKTLEQSCPIEPSIDSVQQVVINSQHDAKQEDAMMVRHCSFKPDLATLLSKDDCQDIHKVYLTSFVIQESKQPSQGSSASFESQNEIHQQKECGLEQALKEPLQEHSSPSQSQVEFTLEPEIEKQQQITYRHSEGQEQDWRQDQNHSATRQEHHSASRQDRYQQLMKNFREYRVQSGHTSAVKIEPTQQTTPKASNQKVEDTPKEVCHISDFIIYQQRESMQNIQHMRTPSLHRPIEEIQLQINPSQFMIPKNSPQESIQTNQATNSLYSLPQEPSTTEFMQDSNATNPAASRLITFSQNDESDSEQPSTQQSFTKILSQQIDLGSGGKLQMNNRPYFKVNPIKKRERNPCPSFREILRERDRSSKKESQKNSNISGQSERDVSRKINFLNYSSNQEGGSLNFQQEEQKKTTPRGKGMSFMEYKMQKQV